MRVNRGFYWEILLGKVVGIMVTWTTYGSWLPGEEKGYVAKGGEVKVGCAKLYADCESRLGKEIVTLDQEMKRVVSDSIRDRLERDKVEILALAVCSNHVHLVVRDLEKDIGDFVAQCKAAGVNAFKGVGIAGKVWTRGYDKRFCFDEAALKNRVRYVFEHGE